MHVIQAVEEKEEENSGLKSVTTLHISHN